MDQKNVTLSWNGLEHKRENILQNSKMYYYDRKHMSTAKLQNLKTSQQPVSIQSQDQDIVDLL